MSGTEKPQFPGRLLHSLFLPPATLCVCVLSHFSHVQVFVTLWTTIAHQASLSMGFSRQENQSGLPGPSPGDLPHPGIKPASPALAGGFFTTSTAWEALSDIYMTLEGRNQTMLSPADLFGKVSLSISQSPRKVCDHFGCLFVYGLVFCAKAF